MMKRAEREFLGYVAQPRRYDGKLDTLLRGKTGKVMLFGVMSEAYRAINGYGVVHEKHGPEATFEADYDSYHDHAT